MRRTCLERLHEEALGVARAAGDQEQARRARVARGRGHLADRGAEHDLWISFDQLVKAFRAGLAEARPHEVGLDDGAHGDRLVLEQLGQVEPAHRDLGRAAAHDDDVCLGHLQFSCRKLLFGDERQWRVVNVGSPAPAINARHGAARLVRAIST